MNRVNPFLVVPTLATFAREVAYELGQGRRVLAVVGPHDPRGLASAVAARVPGVVGDVSGVPVLVSTARVALGEAPPEAHLVIVGALHWSRELLLEGVCEGWYGVVRVCPTGLTRPEMRSLAFAMIADEGLSCAFRTMVVDYACELCAGSVRTLEDALEVCLREEFRPPNAFVRPDAVVRECAERQAHRAWLRAVELGMASSTPTGPVRFEEPAPQVRSFRRALLGSLRASDRAQGAVGEGDSLKLALMWKLNWSYGLCARLDGAWFPGWEILVQGASAWDPDFDAETRVMGVSRPAEAIAGVVACRETRAMQVAFAPVWERYKELAAARVLDGAQTADDPVGSYVFQGEQVRLSRSQDIFHVYDYAQGQADRWQEANGGEPSFYVVKDLRNKVMHGNLGEIRRRTHLQALGQMLSEIAEHERHPFSPRYRRCFY